MSKLLKSIKQYDPSKKNKFAVIFPSDIGLESWMVTNATLPSIKYDKTQCKTIYDDIIINICYLTEKHIIQALLNWYNDSVNNEYDVEICICDPTMILINKFILKKVKLIEIQFGDVTMKSDSNIEIKLRLQFDDCEFIDKYEKNTKHYINE